MANTWNVDIRSTFVTRSTRAGVQTLARTCCLWILSFNEQPSHSENHLHQHQVHFWHTPSKYRRSPLMDTYPLPLFVILIACLSTPLQREACLHSYTTRTCPAFLVTCSCCCCFEWRTKKTKTFLNSELPDLRWVDTDVFFQCVWFNEGPFIPP